MGAGRGLATEPLERVAWVMEASTAPGRQVKRASGPLHVPKGAPRTHWEAWMWTVGGLVWDGRVTLVCEVTSWEKVKLPMKVGQGSEMPQNLCPEQVSSRTFLSPLMETLYLLGSHCASFHPISIP